MIKPRKRKRAVSLRPKRDLVDRLELGLRRSRVPADVIKQAAVAFRIIIGRGGR
jgi:hypothetical protein